MGLFANARKLSREKKYELFIERICPKRGDAIVDIGCGRGKFLEDRYLYKENIIALDSNYNLIAILKEKYPVINCVQADGNRLPFRDSSVPVIFCNAVIEHLANDEEQVEFAKEIQRVGKKYFLTTPNKYFPLEPHFKIPFYQFVPKKIQKWLNRIFGIGLWYRKGEWERINLLSRRDLKRLFPSGEVIKNRITFMAETLVVIGDQPSK